ncbi:hypothetical protein AB4K20DRAFT_1882565 [Rhizopus microsporus]|uniref:Invertebrate defensins family profile domain-containing protein n=1 Tax=Rhizopus microsporus TaxID=58291 RepID=A0A1X0SAB9_RHIZD|nr:hypothetical protein BCV71DRAFT_61139 [Rhizopus microsporus]
MITKFSLTIVCFILIVSTVSCFQTNKDIVEKQRLEKRDCDFSCINQGNCDTLCNNAANEMLLAVCHAGKCYCGYVPN